MAVQCNKECLREAQDIINSVGNTSDKVIPLLQEIQRRKGYLSEELLEAISDLIQIPVSDIYGVATFYSQFRFTPAGKNIIKVCKGTACHVSGADIIGQVISDTLGIQEGETTKDRRFSLESVACLGCCSLAPVVMINDTAYGGLSATKIRKILKDYQHE